MLGCVFAMAHQEMVYRFWSENGPNPIYFYDWLEEIEWFEDLEIIRLTGGFVEY